MSTLFLGRNDLRDLLKMPAVIEAIEQGFKELARGEAKMPAKTHLVLEQGDFRAMPAALPHAAGIKWVSVHPQNPARGLPTVMATLIYNDPATGYPLAVMDATDITAYRTGATAAIASKYLARRDSRILGIVGAGRQACALLLAHTHIFDLRLIKVFDISKTAVNKFIKSFPEYNVQESSLEQAVASDIVCTVTPVRKPLLKREWVLPGTHINAIGADAPGKGELEHLILKEAIVVVDNLEQASSTGEINVPLKKGLFGIDEVYATLDEIIVGNKQGRKDKESITVFDSTGIAIQDLAIAKLIYEKAKQMGGYLSLDLVSASQSD
jgi:alanine dehydrogenase